MGVRLLNTLIRTKYNKDNVKDISILENKIIAIDTNLYIYKYSVDNKLLETFYKLCKVIMQYKIIPIFVFDGDSPEEKKVELEIRKEKKKEAYTKYIELEKVLETTTDKVKIKNIITEINYLKKQSIKVKQTEVNKIRSLVQSFGFTTVIAPDEGEKLCCYLTNNNIAHGILTEDSDAYVYGCNKIYRNINFIKKSVVEYDYSTILDTLKLNKNELTLLSIISQNDYNHNNHTIFDNYNSWIEYKNKNKKNNIMSYILNNKHIHCVNSDELTNMKKIYSFNNISKYKKYNKLYITNGPINIDNIMNIMQEEKFIFI